MLLQKRHHSRFCGAREHSATDRDDMIRFCSSQRLANACRDPLNLFEPDATIVLAWCSYADERNVPEISRFGGGTQMSAAGSAANEILEAELKHRTTAIVDHADFLIVHVDTGHFVSAIRQTRCRHTTHIAHAKHGHLHNGIAPVVFSLLKSLIPCAGTKPFQPPAITASA